MQRVCSYSLDMHDWYLWRKRSRETDENTGSDIGKKAIKQFLNYKLLKLTLR